MSNEKLRTAIRKIAGNGSQILQCEVVSVDIPNRTALVKYEAEYIVKLMTSVGDGLLLIPEVGSSVSVLDGQIIGYSDLDEIWLSGQQHGGLVKVSELVDKLNNLEDKVNSIITTFNAHTHASTGAPPVPLVTGSPLTPTTINDLENPDVKHG